MRRSITGFTIVELLVVIAVIGILTTISLISFTRYQADSRDTQRSSKTTILAEALEKYYDKNGEYPGCLAISNSTGSTVATTVLPGVELNTLLTPKSVAGDTNSIKCMNLTGAAGEPDVFAYVGDGSAACASGQACLAWTLKYKEESTNTIKAVQSRRNTNIATSGTSVLTASAAGFTQIDTNWTAINNAISYDVQIATDSAFTANVQTQTVVVPTISLSVNGLNFSTQYYFRVRANAINSQGIWSNTASAATWGLTTPSVNAVANSSTTFTSSWGAITHAASYNVQCSSDNVTWGAGCAANTGSLNFAWGPTGQGTTFYFRTQAINGSYASSWSPSANATTTIDNPVAFPLYSTNTLPNWNYLNVGSGATCPSGTTVSSDWYANGSYWLTGGVSQSYALNWRTSVTISVASRCITGATSSGFVWADNTASMSLPWATGGISIPGDRTMTWSGVCPKWTTSDNFWWRTQGPINAQGNTPNPGTYSNQGVSWGDGNAHTTLTCNGPWGAITLETTQRYGTNCLPTATLPVCTQ